MEKNNFEKQVREKLSELNIQPSEKTWAGIESRIGKKDSRRKILWLFFVGIFIVAGGIVLFQMNYGSESKTFSHLPETNIKARSEAGSKSDSLDSVSRPDKNIGEKHRNSSFESSTGSNGQKIIASNSAEEIKPRFEKEMTKSKPREVQPDHTVSPDPTVQINEPMSQLQRNKFFGDFSKVVSSENVHSSLDSIENRPGPEVAKFDSTVEMKSTDVETALIHSLIDREKCDKRDQPEAMDLTRKSVGLKIVKPFSFSAKKWEIGFSMAAGKFFLGNGINLGLDLEKNNASSDLSYDSPGPSIGTGNFQSVAGPPSTFENSIEFKAGLILRKSVSRKSSFSTGFGYAYYTNTILIGDLLPSGNYSSVGMLTSYRNNIHFIELPLSMNFQIIDKAKIPLNLSAGVIVSRFVSSDAVQYKSGFYSVDNSLFHKTQFGFSAAFSADFFNRLSVGPYYKYGINQFSKEGLYGKKHLNSFGLKADYIFRKNK